MGKKKAFLDQIFNDAGKARLFLVLMLLEIKQ